MLLRPSMAVRGGGIFAEIAAGFAGGITGGATAFPGAVPTMWCTALGLSKVEQRSIVQPFIFLMQLATLAYFSRLGIFASGMTATFLWCVPAVLAGTWLGLKIFDRVDDAKFRRLVLVFLLVSGVTLMWSIGGGREDAPAVPRTQAAHVPASVVKPAPVEASSPIR